MPRRTCQRFQVYDCSSGNLYICCRSQSVGTLLVPASRARAVESLSGFRSYTTADRFDCEHREQKEEWSRVGCSSLSDKTECEQGSRLYAKLVISHCRYLLGTIVFLLLSLSLSVPVSCSCSCRYKIVTFSARKSLMFSLSKC